MNKENYAKLRFNLISFILFLTFLLVTIGAIYQAVFEFLDHRSFSPRGELVNMNGYQLHLNCLGDGSVTILLESDLTLPSLQWVLVQDELAQVAQVCSYDRAGLGWSESSPFPRKGQEMVEETYRLLRKANIRNPMIVVGYGGGTLLARLFAHRYPEAVSGVVLIDPVHEETNLTSISYRYNSHWEEAQKNPIPLIGTWLGITRLAGNLGGLKAFKAPLTSLPEDLEKEFLALTLYRTKHWPAAAQDLLSLEDLQLEVKNNRGLGDVPVVILANQIEFEANMADEDMENIKVDLERLEGLKTISGRSSLEICSECGNMPPITQPAAVISAILAIYELVSP